MGFDVQPQVYVMSMADRSLSHKSQGSAVFYLTTRNPSIVQLEFSLDSVLDQVHGPFWGVRGFPSNLTLS